MVLEHYKTELELAQYVSKLEAQVKGYKALCERLQAQADEMRSACQWISVADRLPEKSGVYPACSAMAQRNPPEDWVDALCMYNASAKKGESRWQHSSGFYDNGVTHWMPLPTSPTTSGDGQHE